MSRLPVLLLVVAIAQIAYSELQVVDAGEILQIRAKRSEVVEGSGEGSGDVVEGSGDVALKEGSGLVEGSGAEPTAANGTAIVTGQATNATSDESLLSNVLAKETKEEPKETKLADPIAA